MKINGKDYEFKYPTIALVKAAYKIAKESDLLNDVQKLVEADVEGEEWKKAVDVWKRFCELVLVKSDEDLALEKISPFDITGLATSFFQLAAVGQSALKSS